MAYDPYSPKPVKSGVKSAEAAAPLTVEALPGDPVRSENSQGLARNHLRAFVERIERLEEDKKTIADDIRQVYGEAKAMGFDTKVLRRVIAMRKQDADDRAEFEAILDTYLSALGMQTSFDFSGEGA